MIGTIHFFLVLVVNDASKTRFQNLQKIRSYKLVASNLEYHRKDKKMRFQLVQIAHIMYIIDLKSSSYYIYISMLKGFVCYFILSTPFILSNN